MNKIIDEYINEINQVFQETNMIINHFKGDEKVPNIRKMAIISMCIKYEAFTSEIYKHTFPKKQISYNHPWSYTRQIADKLNIDIQDEYVEAHDGWEFYNTLKHINSTTADIQKQLIIKHNINSLKEAQIWIRNSLLNLLVKFYK